MSDTPEEGGLSEDPMEAILEIHQMRVEGSLDAALEGEHRYVLILHELYPNGTTSGDLVDNPEIAMAVGKEMGIGPPTDPNGWGIWVVGPTDEQGEPV